MGIIVEQDVYRKMIEEDIEVLERDMKQGLERDHIKAVLLWSIKALYAYGDVEAVFTAGCDHFPIGRNILIYG